MSNEKFFGYLENIFMKIQLINKFFKTTQQIKQQIKDAACAYEYIGLPVLGFMGIDLIKEYKKKSDFYDRIMS